jgi:DNA repair protein RecO (recombination protein O)
LQWSDEGIVLGARAQGESSVILELMTREHGRHAGLVHGGQSRRMGPVLQAGNSVAVTWRARLDEHIGHYAVEPETLRSARLLGSPMALYGLGTLALHLRLLPERDPHPGLYAAALYLLEHLDEAALAPALFIRFELMLLAELGYGLDLSVCAATGQVDDLAYVSPRSGRAVSREAGAPYRDRLLTLPGFLRGEGEAAHAGETEVAAGFRLTGYFLDAHVWGPQGRSAPDERARFVAQATWATQNKAGSAMLQQDPGADSIRDRA